MQIIIDVPDRDWAKLLDLAETNATTTANVVEAAIRDALRPSELGKLRIKARRNHILQAYSDGLTDAEIAERTGEIKAYVASTRRAAHLPPNRVGTSTGRNTR
ncbi:hypothetical protein [uncultured Microbacterium sp.]|uniref:hypothetical protein n=1 Tax=uncultured Microbacterium sp. TaxID=191216 RepID=UPI0025E23A69|nr:hypothetical protein [uncultured Microbacterium sp.]